MAHMVREARATTQMWGLSLDDVGGAVGGLKDQVQHGAQSAAEQVQNQVDEHRGDVDNVVEQANNLKDQASDAARQQANNLQDRATSDIDTVKQQLGDQVNHARDKLSNVSQKVADSARDKLSNVSQQVADQVHSGFEGSGGSSGSPASAPPVAAPSPRPMIDPADAAAVPTTAPVSQAGPRVGAIHWTYHPEYCIDVINDEGDPVAGAKLQTWSCKSQGMEYPQKKFRMPESGTGVIRWDAHPDFCIHVVGGSGLQGNPNAVAALNIWPCDDVNEATSMSFIVPKVGTGVIKWASNPDLCLDIVNGAVQDGADVQMVSCKSDFYNEHFYVPAQCKQAPPAGPIIWVTHPDRCLGARVNEQGANPVLEMETCTAGAPSQGFTLPACQIGQIEFGMSGKCIRVAPQPDGSDTVRDGALLDLWDCDDHDQHMNMVFTLPFIASGGSVELTTVMWAAAAGPIRWSRHPWLCIDVKDGKLTDGTPLQLWGCPLDDEENTPNKNFIVPS